MIIARLRAESEEVYGQRLADIAPAADRVTGGFSGDDGATVRKVRPLSIVASFAAAHPSNYD